MAANTREDSREDVETLFSSETVVGRKRRTRWLGTLDGQSIFLLQIGALNSPTIKENGAITTTKFARFRVSSSVAPIGNDVLSELTIIRANAPAFMAWLALVPKLQPPRRVNAIDKVASIRVAVSDGVQPSSASQQGLPSNEMLSDTPVAHSPKSAEVHVNEIFFVMILSFWERVHEESLNTCDARPCLKNKMEKNDAYREQRHDKHNNVIENLCGFLVVRTTHDCYESMSSILFFKSRSSEIIPRREFNLSVLNDWYISILAQIDPSSLENYFLVENTKNCWRLRLPQKYYYS
jgi:hypothetical protein